MKRSPVLCRKRPKARVSADEIAGMATRGEDVASHFTNKFIVVGLFIERVWEAFPGKDA